MAKFFRFQVHFSVNIFFIFSTSVPNPTCHACWLVGQKQIPSVVFFDCLLRYCKSNCSWRLLSCRALLQERRKTFLLAFDLDSSACKGTMFPSVKVKLLLKKYAIKSKKDLIFTQIFYNS